MLDQFKIKVLLSDDNIKLVLKKLEEELMPFVGKQIDCKLFDRKIKEITEKYLRFDIKTCFESLPEEKN